ncbi:unnamed protein product [Amoebophrya sp. A120]|nr:unnamed protein product [Amoebophrya sp. A120]|eukprot:GSA120T00023664001.1
MFGDQSDALPTQSEELSPAVLADYRRSNNSTAMTGARRSALDAEGEAAGSDVVLDELSISESDPIWRRRVNKRTSSGATPRGDFGEMKKQHKEEEKREERRLRSQELFVPGASAASSSSSSTNPAVLLAHTQDDLADDENLVLSSSDTDTPSGTAAALAAFSSSDSDSAGARRPLGSILKRQERNSTKASAGVTEKVPPAPAAVTGVTPKAASSTAGAGASSSTPTGKNRRGKRARKNKAKAKNAEVASNPKPPPPEKRVHFYPEPASDDSAAGEETQQLALHLARDREIENSAIFAKQQHQYSRTNIVGAGRGKTKKRSLALLVEDAEEIAKSSFFYYNDESTGDQDRSKPSAPARASFVPSTAAAAQILNNPATGAATDNEPRADKYVDNVEVEGASNFYEPDGYYKFSSSSSSDENTLFLQAANGTRNPSQRALLSTSPGRQFLSAPRTAVDFLPPRFPVSSDLSVSSTSREQESSSSSLASSDPLGQLLTPLHPERLKAVTQYYLRKATGSFANAEGEQDSGGGEQGAAQDVDLDFVEIDEVEHEFLNDKPPGSVNRSGMRMTTTSPSFTSLLWNYNYRLAAPVYVTIALIAPILLLAQWLGLQAETAYLASVAPLTRIKPAGGVKKEKGQLHPTKAAVGETRGDHDPYRSDDVDDYASFEKVSATRGQTTQEPQSIADGKAREQLPIDVAGPTSTTNLVKLSFLSTAIKSGSRATSTPAGVLGPDDPRRGQDRKPSAKGVGEEEKGSTTGMPHDSSVSTSPAPASLTSRLESAWLSMSAFVKRKLFSDSTVAVTATTSNKTAGARTTTKLSRTGATTEDKKHAGGSKDEISETQPPQNESSENKSSSIPNIDSPHIFSPLTNSAVFSSFSPLSVYFLSISWLGEEVETRKWLAVVLCSLGVFAHQPQTVFSSTSAFLFAIYAILITQYVRDPVIFLGYIGLYVLAIGIPLISICDSGFWEKIFIAAQDDEKNTELLSNLFLFSVMSSFFSHYLWAWGILLTSPTIATIGLLTTAVLSAVFGLDNTDTTLSTHYAAAACVGFGLFLFVLTHVTMAGKRSYAFQR